MNRHLLTFGLAVTLLTPFAFADEQKFTCSRDVWVSAVDGKAEGWEDTADDKAPKESDTSMGKTAQLKLKTIQEMAILDFDLAGLKGKTVDGGWLWMHVVPEAAKAEVARVKLPFERKHLLRNIGVSTVSNDWVEGNNAQSYHVDTAGFGASFRAASYSKKPWAWAGGNLTDVTFGNGNSLQWHTALEDKDDLWIRVKVSPELIQSLIARDGFGWCVMDEVGYGLANNFIHSREQNAFAPYLVVNVTGADAEAPASPKVAVAAAAADAHMDSGAATITLEGPADAFCYFVTVNGQEVPRWRVPHPAKGKSVVVLDDLKAGEDLDVAVFSCDAAGNRSAATKAAGKASVALAAVPKLPESQWKPKGGEPPVRGGKLRAWVAPEVSKISPTDGALFEAAELKADPLNYRRANSNWDGATGQIRAFGGRGEIAAFQLCVEATGADPLKGVKVSAADLAAEGSEGAKIPSANVRFFRVWCTPIPEYPVPIAQGAGFDVPWPENKIEGQKVQSLYVDVIVPADAKPGVYAGKLTISAEGVEAFDLPLALKVHDVTIPAKMRFNPALNIYQTPAKPGSPEWFECFRVAHYNRCTLSITQPGHSDGIKFGPPIEGEGKDVRVKDWANWDKAYGPMLDGSAFKDLPRANQPLATCQVPLSHGFPLPLDRYHLYKGPRSGEQVALIHALTAAPIEQSFSDDYKTGFASYSRQIVKHFEEKGWTDTYFMFYLDGKVQYRATGSGTSYWLLDEPYNYDDWMALRWFGSLWMDAIKDTPKKAKWGYLCDISRPQWTRDWLNGVMTIMDVGGLTREIKRVQIMGKEGPMEFTSYGACNKTNASNWNSAVWCLQTFLAGGEGILPWQSLGRSDSISKPDDNGLIIPNTLGQGAVGSMRIRALRRGAQDCEILLELGAKYGFNREQLRALVVQKIATTGTLKQANEDDASAPVSFGALDPDKFSELREGLLRLIEEKK